MSQQGLHKCYTSC